MARLRVQGIVRFANMVRRELAGPISADALETLRQQATESMEQLELVMADHELTPAALSPQARKAYEFLKSVDFDAVSPSEAADDELYRPGTVRLPGLRRFIRELMDCLARPSEPTRLNALYRRVRDKAGEYEEMLDEQCIRPVHLKDEPRALRAWLRYFAERKHFDVYVSAVARARRAAEAHAAASRTFPLPVNVHFGPMKGVYRIRQVREGTRLSLPTPMICLPREAFDALAAAAFGRGRTGRLIEEHMLSPAYQGILAELEALAGEGAASAAGLFHDLDAAFDRVNGEYFAGRLARPRLLWSRALTMRKFGHYDRVHDQVVVSATLDAESVPAFVVDFIVYHELLHKKLGVSWRGARRAVHTAAFRREEGRFRRRAEAEAALKRLTRGAR